MYFVDVTLRLESREARRCVMQPKTDIKNKLAEKSSPAAIYFRRPDPMSTEGISSAPVSRPRQQRSHSILARNHRLKSLAAEVLLLYKERFFLNTL